MQKVNEYIEKLKVKTKNDIRQKIESDQGAYKELLKNLLIQVSNRIILYSFITYFCLI